MASYRLPATDYRLPATGGTAATLAAMPTLTPDVLVVSRQIPTNYIAGYYAAPPPSHSGDACCAGDGKP